MCIHFLLILVFANPYTKAKDRLSYYAEWYVYPYFVQNWNLFVPPPETNYKLFVEYEDNGIQRKDIFQEMISGHQENPLAGRGALLLAFSNSIYFFEKSTQLLQPLNGPVKGDLNFEMLENSTLSYLRSTRKINIRSVKIKLLVENINSSSSRVYFN